MPLTMEYGDLHSIQADWLMIGIWEADPLGSALLRLDSQLNGALSRLIASGDITGKAKEVTPLLAVQNIAATRVLVVGLGKTYTADPATVISSAAAAGRYVSSKPQERIAIALPDAVRDMDAATMVRLIGIGLRQGCEGPGLHKSKPDRHLPRDLVIIAPADASRPELDSAASWSDCEGRAVSLACELVNMPPSDLYPETFAERARAAARRVDVECLVFDENQLAAERMNALLAVARGSARPPRVVVLRYKGSDGPLLGLVGKGVTFDSGGLSLKSNEHMVDMKCDMAGAAAVLASIQAIAELKLPVNVIGILAIVENMPGGRAMKLGDVLHARNGKTIEVLNTDAEGRLILADVLSYVVDQKAAHIIDLATLTGACVVALGTEVAGLMTNNEDWSRRVLAAAQVAGERVWPLPMFPFYSDMIKSDVADMRNTGGTRYGGAISAAKFLEEFVGGVPWVHLDIAGPAWAEHDSATRASGGTGCMTRTLIEVARGYA